MMIYVIIVISFDIIYILIMAILVLCRYQKAWRLVMNSRLMRNQLRQFDDLFRLFEQYYPNSTINLERLFYLNNVLNIQVSEITVKRGLLNS